MTWMVHTHGQTPFSRRAPPAKKFNLRPVTTAKTAKTRGPPAPPLVARTGVRPDKAAAGLRKALDAHARSRAEAGFEQPSKDARRGVMSRAMTD